MAPLLGRAARVRLPNLVHLYRVRLRARWVPELLALVGIAVGVALVFAALVASTSLTSSVRRLSEGIVGNADFQVSARSPAGFDQRLFNRMRGADGVAAAAPVVEARANLAGPGGLRSVLLVGGDPRFAQVGGQLLRHPVRVRRHAQPGMVLPSPLAAELGAAKGRKLRVETGAGVTRVRMVGQLDRGEIGSLAESPVALAPLRLVQAVAGTRGRISRVFVEAEPGREREAEAALRRIAGDRLDVGPADEEVAIFARAAYPTNQSTALFSVLSALVGFLFALSAMLLTVPQRRRLIADLRVAGYEPRTVVQLLLSDALVLGVAGALLGLLLGDQASRHLFGGTPGYLTSAFAIGSQRIVTWQSVAISAGSGALAACVAVLAPIRDAFSRESRRPAALAVASGRESWLMAGGFALLSVTAAIAAFRPHAAMAGIATLVLALLMLLPVLMRVAAAGFDRVGRRLKSPVAIFALLELRSDSARIRAQALVATGAIAVFATVSIGGARADLQRGLDAVSVDTDSSADVWVTFGGPANILGTTPFAVPRPELVAIERAPGVRGVSRDGGSFLDVGDHRAWVLAPPRSAAQLVPASQIRDGASLADDRLRRGGWLTLSEDIATVVGVGVGDRFTLPSPVPTVFRIAALTTNVGWPGGAIVLNAADFARAWGTDEVAALGIQIERGASPAAVARSIERTLGPRSPLRAETRAERMRRQLAAAHSGLSRLGQIAAMVLIAAVLAMAASMGGVIWQRRPGFAALKMHGVEELELWRSLLFESGLLLGTGCLLGALFGLLGQVLLDRALDAITGFPVFYELAASIALQVLLLVTFVAVAIVAIPGWFAVRVRPVGSTAA